MSIRVFASLALLCAFLAAPAARASEARPNIVLIITDDQRWDSLWAMPTVQTELVGKGATFINGFVANPLCCPSRASILTGKYSHSTGIYRNRPPKGGFADFDDDSTVATWLDAAGYQNALIGKYFNGYDSPDYTPPGWDEWVAKLGNPYYDYELTDGEGGTTGYGHSEADYSTDVLAAEADEFIRDAQPEDPIFLYFSVGAPHDQGGRRPPDPAPRHLNSLDGLERLRPPNYDEGRIEDKPAHVRNKDRITRAEARHIDLMRQRQYESLLAVDDAVYTILGALADTGRLDNTMIVYTSDNGYFWGEHRLTGKKLAYEESIRVPYVVRYDPVTGGSSSSIDSMVLNIDLAPTFADLAGTDAPAAEGESLLPLLKGEPVSWRNEFLVEASIDRISYCAVRMADRIYVYWASGEEEYYDLAGDPFELKNTAGGRRVSSSVRAMRRLIGELCDPAPPGLKLPRDWRAG